MTVTRNGDGFYSACQRVRGFTTCVAEGATPREAMHGCWLLTLARVRDLQSLRDPCAPASEYLGDRAARGAAA